MGIKCFLTEPTNTVRRYLRRYSLGANCAAGDGLGYHNASMPFEDVDRPIDAPSVDRPFMEDIDPAIWPIKCDRCDYIFSPEDEKQINEDRLYVRPDTGETFRLQDAPPGAIYRADWMEDLPAWRGPDGRCLVVVLPNGHPWMIDGLANNCTDREDFMEGGHKCWVREGEAPLLTVGKRGKTCAAGAGSILSGDYHGFLTNGEFNP